MFYGDLTLDEYSYGYAYEFSTLTTNDQTMSDFQSYRAVFDDFTPSNLLQTNNLRSERRRNAVEDTVSKRLRDEDDSVVWAVDSNSFDPMN